MQASFGRLASPEQLEPDVSVRRSTASVSYNAPVGVWWQTTFAFGHNSPSSGAGSNAWLLESALKPALAHTLFARLERVDKDELFLPGEPLFGHSFTIEKLSVGYIYDFLRCGRARSRAWRPHQQLQLPGDAERDLRLSPHLVHGVRARAVVASWP